MEGLEALAARPTHPLPKGSPRLAPDELRRLLGELGHGWTVVGDRLRKPYKLADFAAAVAFVTKVGALADEADHHPDIAMGWGRAAIELWTHTVGGLSELDFILAARIERAAASPGV
jgi:4a-hydroxytetrahydrobiopterin dehydratase